MYEEQVKDFLAHVGDLSPLFFQGGFDEGEIKEHGLGWLILKILDVSNKEASYMIKDDRPFVQTGAQRWRSAVDIWRHVIFYKPNVTIYRVMRYIHNNEKHLCGQVCHRIHQRVFKLRVNTTYASEVDTSEQDEFHLYFHQWAEVGEKGGK